MERVGEFEDGVKVTLDESADLLRLDEIVIHRLGGERVGAQEDAALDFGPEAGAARVRVKVAGGALVG